MGRMHRALKVGSLWKRLPDGGVVRLTAIEGDRVSYTATTDLLGRVRSTWVDSFEKRYAPTVRMTVAEITKHLRNAASTGVPAILPADACRTLVEALRK